MFSLKPTGSSLSIAALALLTSSLAIAQPATSPKTIALVSMVGDEFTVVTQKQATGSNVIDNYHRRTIRVPNQGINRSVLRGLDQAVAREHPNAERVFLAIPHDNDTLPPAPRERENAAYEKALAAVTKMPEREKWDQIILVTPRWLFSQRAGMASKLSGIGLYIQPLESTKLDPQDDNAALSDFGLKFDDEVETTRRGFSTRSETYIAPFFYAVVTTLDAKTLNVIKREERYDFRKVVNPDSNAVRIQNSFSTDQLAGLIDKFIETAAIRSVTDKRGSVEIGPLRDSRTPSAPEKK